VEATRSAGLGLIIGCYSSWQDYGSWQDHYKPPSLHLSQLREQITEVRSLHRGRIPSRCPSYSIMSLMAPFTGGEPGGGPN
jgi:hypothetical protein